MAVHHLTTRLCLAVCFMMTFFLLAFIQPALARTNANFPIIGVLHAGGAPEALAVDTKTYMLYIAYESPGLLVGFDPISGTVRWRTPLSDSATDVQVDSTSHHIYASAVSYSSRRSNLYVLDGTNGKILATLYSGNGDNSITLDTRRHIAYATSVDQGIIYKYTFLSGWQTGPLSIQTSQFSIGKHPEAIGVNSRLGRLYIADSVANQVTVINEDSGRTLATIAVASLPISPLRVDEATGRVYVVCSTGQELDIIDGKTNTVIARVPVAPYPEGMAFNTATGQLYVADEGNKEGSGQSDSGTTISVIDGQSLTLSGTLQIGRGPDGVEADPALHRVYVAVEDSNAVVEIADSTDLPLTSRNTSQQLLIAHETASLLQFAMNATLIVMCLTIVGSALGVLLPRWRVRESPQTQPGGASSHSKTHTPQP
jgi:YVTN family beta-propeller protein